MIALHIFITPFVVLLLAYIVFIQHERGGAWRILKLVGIPAYLLDVFLNYTLVSLYLWEHRTADEYTISQRLKRLVRNTDWRGKIARPVAAMLNYLAPSGKHV